jgi:BNR repeat-like domain
MVWIEEGTMKRTGIIIWAVGLCLISQPAQADWRPAKRITWTSGWSEYPALAVDPSGNPHVVWDDDTTGKSEIYYKGSPDGGATWTTAKKLSSTTAGCYRPDIAVDSSGALHVVWYDYAPGNYEIYYKKSTDGGETWTATKRLTWNGGGSEYPDIAVDSSGNPQLVWTDDTPGNYEVHYRKSTDGGKTWAAAKRLTWNADSSQEPVIAVDSSGNPHVVWFDRTPGNDEIYYKKSPDGGTTWDPAKRLTWDSYGSWYPSIAVDSSDMLHLAWENATVEAPEIYYKKSTDGGATWTPMKRLTWTAGLSGSPQIAVDSSNNPHVVWYDDTPGHYEIFYKKSTDGGTMWTAAERLTWTAGSYDPDMASDPSGHVHVVWQNDLPGNYEIYYMKSK